MASALQWERDPEDPGTMRLEDASLVKPEVWVPYHSCLYPLSQLRAKMVSTSWACSGNASPKRNYGKYYLVLTSVHTRNPGRLRDTTGLAL